MSNTLESYLNLIPAMNRQQPNFIATLSAVCGASVDLQDMMASMIPKFDIDVAVGDQLDILGQWIGETRNVHIPISGVYFEWGGVDPSVGWSFGTWVGPDGASAITSLPDDTYRTLLKAKIGANKWDGTTDGMYEVWDSVFSELSILIQDYQDMSYDFIVVGGTVDTLTKAIITGGYIPLKPEGVRVRNYYFPVDSGPIFGWNVDSEFLAGWNEGSWAERVSPT